mmetsp:Transcript_18464/g.50110  ORF Transcript_18464/g.50110 Transcript_18464/m.50110 type:complete len:202 (+) Transcript_18464:402-1007(+)
MPASTPFCSLLSQLRRVSSSAAANRRSSLAICMPSSAACLAPQPCPACAGGSPRSVPATESLVSVASSSSAMRLSSWQPRRSHCSLSAWYSCKPASPVPIRISSRDRDFTKSCLTSRLSTLCSMPSNCRSTSSAEAARPWPAPSAGSAAGCDDSESSDRVRCRLCLGARRMDARVSPGSGPASGAARPASRAGAPWRRGSK